MQSFISCIPTAQSFAVDSQLVLLPVQVPLSPELELQVPAADTPGPLPTRVKLPAKVMANPCDTPEPASGMVDAPPKVTLPVPANGPVAVADREPSTLTLAFQVPLEVPA